MKIIGVLFCISMFAASASSNTLIVPLDFATIQSAIDAASPGDTVLVADGVYSGEGNRDLTFNGINLTLKSANGPEFTTIQIGGTTEDLHRGISFETGQDTTSVIDGFTIGYGSVSQAAVYIQSNAGATIKNCKITQSSWLGIVAYYGNRVNIRNCEVTNCVQDGAYLFPEVEIRNSLFANNGGHGLALDGLAKANVSNCTFIGNGENGFLMNGIPPKADLKLAAEDSIIVTNSVAAYNSGCGFTQYFWGLPIRFSCNNSYANFGWDQFCALGDSAVDVNNISADPLFCDPGSGDFHISNLSPCALANNECAVLMGAYGIGCTSICCANRGDFNHSGGEVPVDISDITALVQYLFAGGAAPFCFEEGDTNGSGQIDISDLTAIVDFIFVGGSTPPSCP